VCGRWRAWRDLRPEPRISSPSVARTRGGGVGADGQSPGPGRTASRGRPTAIPIARARVDTSARSLSAVRHSRNREPGPAGAGDAHVRSPLQGAHAAIRGAAVTRYFLLFPSRTTISRRSRSTSLTRSRAHSRTRSPAPYNRDAISHGVPCRRPRTAVTSELVRTTGSRDGRRAWTRSSSHPSSVFSTCRYRKRIALSAWFCVEALTLRSTAR
jgi:hypothetical protein